jgi:hypothetical protein
VVTKGELIYLAELPFEVWPKFGRFLHATSGRQRQSRA